MGIVGLWDVLGDGEVTSIAQLAAEHFERTQRPLRIAVDEAGWRFKNLTDAQVAFIRKKEPRANPIEKLIFWRLTHLLKLNIQLLFVFDGPKRPWKRGGPAGRINYGKIKLLRELLDVFRIPQHRAPAEAEAECARLQELGVVDAVWSDDGDTLMFGCGLLIRDCRKDNKKSETHVRVYRVADILQKHKLDRHGLIAFAMLSGGDYDTKGVPSCGPQLAHQAAKDGLGKSLCECDESSLREWRLELVGYFRSKCKAIEVPLDFPQPRHLKNYKDPKVTESKELQSLPVLRRGWDVPINEELLRTRIRGWFNIWTRGFMKHIAPILLAQKLNRILSGQIRSNDILDIELVQPKRGKVEQRTDVRKVTFSPYTATDLRNVSTQPPDEDWSVFTSKSGAPYDPEQRIECELLECVLRGVLPETSFLMQQDHNPTSNSKRKTTGDKTGKLSVERPQKRQRCRSTQDTHQSGGQPLGLSTSFVSQINDVPILGDRPYSTGDALQSDGDLQDFTLALINDAKLNSQCSMTRADSRGIASNTFEFSGITMTVHKPLQMPSVKKPIEIVDLTDD